MKTKIFFLSILLVITALIIIPSCKKDKKKDTTPPVITLKSPIPPSVYYVNKDSNYKDPGYTAVDDVDGDITSNVILTPSVINTADTGTFQVKYNVSDKAGNAAVEKTRTVRVMVF
jgi:hypothetical protein